MAKVRKDNKGRNLRPGETQRADGSYMYVYKLGTKKKYLYDSDLASLRVKEKQINKDKDDGIRTQEAMKLTLNDMFKVYMNNNIKLKPSTRANYLYLWDFYVKEEPFANMPLPQIHRSDILAFYTKLLKKNNICRFQPLSGHFPRKTPAPCASSEADLVIPQVRSGAESAFSLNFIRHQCPAPPCSM